MPRSLDQSIVIATGVLNAMHINQGFNAPTQKETGYDYTQFATLKVPSRKVMYFRTYEDMHWRQIDVGALDFSVSKSMKLASNVAFRQVNADFV